MSARFAGALAGFLALSALFLAMPGYAQFTSPEQGADLSISLSPAHPDAGDTVRLSARSLSLDLSEITLTWHANGKVIAQGDGVDTATVVAGDLGTETKIVVDAIMPVGTVASAQVTIIPTGLDLLVDSDSFVPPFYRGGARVSAGVDLHLQAIPRFKLPTGFFAADADLIYTWRRNGEVIAGVSGRGRSSITIPSPHLFGTDIITLEVRTRDTALSSARSLSLSSTEPILLLYKDHPLFGILYNDALSASTFIPESEMTFAAIPYFAQVQSANDAQLIFDWWVNNTRVAQNAARPSEITINAKNSTGIALLGLELTHATNYYMDAKSSWNINFSESSGVQDQFHSVDQ